MVAAGVRLTFSPFPIAWLVIAAAALAVTFEWARWTFRPRPIRRIRCVVVGLVLAVPVAAGLWGLLNQSALWAAPVLAGMALVWSLRSYRRTTATISRGAKTLLVVLRVAMIASLLAVATQPVLQHTRTEPVREGLVLLVDTSRSMARRDVSPTEPDETPATPISRMDAVRQALLTNQAALRALSQRYSLRINGFDTAAGGAPEKGPSTASLLPVLSARGEQTAIGDAIQRAVDGFLAADVPVAGVCVITDGCNNTSDMISPVDQAETLAARGVTLWMIGVGSTRAGNTAALNLRNLQAADPIDAMNKLPISVDVEGVALTGREIQLQCRLGEEVVASQLVRFDADVQVRRAHFEITPSQAGFHRLTVSARPGEMSGQPVVGRRQVGKMVHVVNRQLRALYIEGRRRLESKFIAAALTGAKRFKMTRWVLTEPSTAPTDDSGTDTFWTGHHVVMLGDCPASTFGRRRLAELARLVAQEGRGLVMIGGRESFADGGWADTPLAAALPVDVPTSTGALPGPVKAVPTQAGLDCQAMQIADDGDHAGAWASLRPLRGANALGAPKPAATTLAATDAGNPLIVVQEFGSGRSVALGFDTSWQWVMSADDTVGHHKRFWRQMMLYAANPTANAWVVTDRARYDQRRLARGASIIEITAGVEDWDGSPLSQTPVTVTLTGPDGQIQPVAVSAAGDVRKGRLPTLTKGRYVLELQAEVDGRKLSARHVFEVIHPDLETAEVVANVPLLRRMGQIAGGGGGGYTPVSELADVLERFTHGRPARRKRYLVADPLVDRHRWPLLGAILGMLGVEWIVRKRLGLV